MLIAGPEGSPKRPIHANKRHGNGEVVLGLPTCFSYDGRRGKKGEFLKREKNPKCTNDWEKVTCYYCCEAADASWGT